jgi:hypothetical protein
MVPIEPGRRASADAVGRRTAAVHQLLGRVVRSVIDDEGGRDETVSASREGASEAGSVPGPSASAAASGRVSPVSRRRRTGRGTDGVGSKQAEGRADAGDEIWSNDVTDVQGPWSVSEDGTKIGAVKRVSKLSAVRGQSATPGHAGLWLQRGVFGALLVAIALLVLLSGADEDAGQEQGGSNGAPTHREGAARSVGR